MAHQDMKIPLLNRSSLAGKPWAWERQGKGTRKVDSRYSQRRVPGVPAACAKSGPRQPERADATCHPGTHCAPACANDPR